MDQIEIILRTTDPSGKVTEQILAKFDTEEPVDVSSAVFCIIGNIRQKLRKVTKKEYIQTVWGVGYKFVDVPGE